MFERLVLESSLPACQKRIPRQYDYGLPAEISPALMREIRSALCKSVRALCKAPLLYRVARKESKKASKADAAGPQDWCHGGPACRYARKVSMSLRRVVEVRHANFRAFRLLYQVDRCPYLHHCVQLEDVVVLMPDAPVADALADRTGSVGPV